jgi:hypothetical protein
VAAKARGVAFGRPKKMRPDQQQLAKEPVRDGKSISAVARTFDVHPATIYRVIEGCGPYATFLFRSAAQASLEEIAPAARHKLPDLRQTQGGSVEHGAIGLWPAGRARRRHQCWPRQPEHNLGAG